MKLSKARLLSCVIALWGTLASTLLPALAQEEEGQAKLPRVAHTAPPVDDIDFELLGEFVGPITTPDGGFAPLGLQIRPVGQGRFEALQFMGGLPGQESFEQQAVSLIGRRLEDSLILSGGHWAIFVDREHCTLIDRDGQTIGRLERLQRGSPTMNAQAPAGAFILFDGTNTDQFVSGEMTEEGLLKAGAELKPMFQDFDMHVEFRLPYMPNSDGQQRGNSGCYLQSRYEVQVLDSFAQLPQFNGCSSLYRTKSPDVNMCFPPLVWQTYDIRFTAPRWSSDGSKLRNAHITVWHNGVKTQDDFELKNKTGAGKAEEPVLLPTKLQDHSDPVVYRNIWLIDRGLTPGIEFPIMGITPAAPSEETETAAEQEEPAAAASQPEEDQPAQDQPAQEQPAAASQSAAGAGCAGAGCAGAGRTGAGAGFTFRGPANC